ncbi:hypothetical protein FIBSPDRAFT_1039460 [Athelia psychrophila]|uniref:Uncharacterized protein n=1 Tax=Athelia psychrophila TaxID=1759441 RepID=A0A166RW62_9AGAM|nr:hypothetical protein FIBSPDRAFT_1039460 [Fibularhizoctonia sp. CBS 109695]
MPDSRLSLHVYRPNAINVLDQDRVVKSSSKTAPLYYLSLNRKNIGWSALLRRDAPDAPSIFEIARSGFIGNPFGRDESMGGSNLDISVRSTSTSRSRWQTRLLEVPFPSTEHLFRGPDGQQYCWKSSRRFSLGNGLSVN